MKKRSVLAIFLVLINVIILGSLFSYVWQIREGDYLIVSNVPIRVSDLGVVTRVQSPNQPYSPSY